jgi:hypothetical protein
MITKTFCTYKRNSLRAEKSSRISSPAPAWADECDIQPVIGGWMSHSSGRPLQGQRLPVARARSEHLGATNNTPAYEGEREQACDPSTHGGAGGEGGCPHGIRCQQGGKNLRIQRGNDQFWAGRARMSVAGVSVRGALIAIDRGDTDMHSELQVARRAGMPVRTNAMAVAQAWRDAGGRQVRLAKALRDMDVALLAGPGDRVTRAILMTCGSCAGRRGTTPA